jgi:nicotinamidase-related amidase
MEKFFLNRDESSFLIIDIQEKLAAVMKMKDAVVGNCLHLIELSKMLHTPVTVTEQYPKGLGHTVEDLRNAMPGYKPIEKLTFSCCEEPAFMKEVKDLDRKTIILTGMETHICVLQTCIGLLHNGFDVHLVRDAVCSRTKENWKTGIEFMRDAGAVITSTETVLFQLLNKAGTEEFRTISKRIR